MRGSDPSRIPDPNIMQYPRPGLGHVPSYQVSGVPFLSGSIIVNGEEKRIDFPRVAKHILIKNRAPQDLRVHFVSTGSITARSALML